MKRIKLKDISEIKNGSTPSSKNSEYYNGNIIWITPKDLSDQKSKYIEKGERNITKKGLESCSATLLPKNTILLSSRAPIGLLAIAKNELCTNQGFKNIIPNSNELDNEFLYYYLKTKLNDLNNLGSGTTFKELSKSSIENFEIILPNNLPIQKKIASVLSSLDAKIELNNKINAELEAMAKTIYDYWFVQFDFPFDFAKGKPCSHQKEISDGKKCKCKPYKSSGGKMVWNDVLKREIPEGWVKGTLSDIGTIIGGSTPSREKEEYFEKDGIAWITPKDLSLNIGNKYITKGENGVSKKGLNAANLTIMPKDTVLLSSRAPIGYMATAREDFTTNQGFKSFVPNKGYSTPFIFYTIKNTITHIISSATGSTFKEAPTSLLKSIPIILPTKIITEKYKEVAQPIFEMQNKLEFESQSLVQLRDWLLPMLMNGQVTV